MSVISIGLHDVVEASELLPQGDAGTYSITHDQLLKHLDAIHSSLPEHCVCTVDGMDRMDRAFMITVDDGYSSFYRHIAPAVEAFNWRAHFYVTTDRIGHPGYVDAVQLRELASRGHIIGSHSCSHPERMSVLTRQQLMREWADSLSCLSDIIGQRIKFASVPGGFYSRLVGETAAEAGIEALFISKPTISVTYVNNCLILGRYFVRQSTSERSIARLAQGDLLPRVQQSAFWYSAELAKRALGSSYLQLRRTLLNRNSLAS